MLLAPTRLRVYVAMSLEGQKATRLRLHDQYNRALAFPPFSAHILPVQLEPQVTGLSRDTAVVLSLKFVTASASPDCSGLRF